MTNVYFEENNSSNIYSQNSKAGYQKKGIPEMLVNLGIVKDIKTANIILIVSTILFFSISIFIVFKFLLPQNQASTSVNQNYKNYNPIKERIERNKPNN